MVATRKLGMNVRSLWRAVGTVMECLGMFLLFLILNVALGLAFVLFTRGFTNQFVSAYSLSDSTLIFLSLFQGFVFQLWWRD